MESKYEWKIKSFGRKVDPDKVIAEIEQCENLFGKITAETLLKFAENEDTQLHKFFEWDDSKAANMHRLSQARTILNNIEVKIISDGEPKSIPVYEVVRVDEVRQYKHFETLTYDEVEQVKENTFKQLNTLKTKLSIYNRFKKIVTHIDSALLELQES